MVLTRIGCMALVVGSAIMIWIPGAGAQGMLHRNTPPSARSAAKPGKTTPRVGRISLDLKNATLNAALNAVFHQAGKKYTLDPALNGLNRVHNVTLRFADLTFPDALNHVVQLSSRLHTPLTSHIENGLYVFSPLSRGQGALGTQPVTLHINGDFRAALNALLKQNQTNYVYAFRALPTNTARIEMTRAPFEEALSTLLRVYPARPPIQPHVTRGILSLMQSNIVGSKATFKTRRITLRLTNAPLPDAFRALFAALGTDYTLDNRVQGRVTLSVRNASYRHVMDALTAQATHPLTVRERGNILLIMPRK